MHTARLELPASGGGLALGESSAAEKVSVAGKGSAAEPRTPPRPFELELFKMLNAMLVVQTLDPEP